MSLFSFNLNLLIDLFPTRLENLLYKKNLRKNWNEFRDSNLEKLENRKSPSVILSRLIYKIPKLPPENSLTSKSDEKETNSKRLKNRSLVNRLLFGDEKIIADFIEIPQEQPAHYHESNNDQEQIKCKRAFQEPLFPPSFFFAF